MADIVQPASIVIDEHNAHVYAAPYVGPDGLVRARGLIPRNWRTNPQGFYRPYAEPFSLPLIPESQWDDIIRQQESDQSSLQHVRNRGNYGNRIPSTDQNGKGYCWMHSTTSALMLLRASLGMPYEELSAYMGACIIKNFQDEGGWNSESLKFVIEKGLATSKTWPIQSMSRSNVNDAMWTDAARMRVTEWWELSDEGDTAKNQLATLLLSNVPTMIDLNWWGHSVCAVRLIKRDPFTIRIWNSWGDSWSDAGMGDLVGSKAIPNGANAPRVTMAA